MGDRRKPGFSLWLHRVKSLWPRGTGGAILTCTQDWKNGFGTRPVRPDPAVIFDAR